MKIIVFDTSFLITAIRFKVDIFKELERICDFKFKLAIVDKTLDELNSIISKQKGKHKKAASLAFDLLKAKNVDIIKSKSNLNVDQFLIKYSGENDIVATQDSNLKKALLNKKVPVIVLRGKKYLNMIKI